jgi:hypothetical protein
MYELKSIEEEAEDCRQAFKGVKEGAFVWLCHHEVLVEVLKEEVENRIRYILTWKPEGERAIRLREFRPVKEELPKEYSEARQKYDEAWQKYDEVRQKYDEAQQKYDEELTSIHLKAYPDTVWDKRTIIH